MSTIKVNNIVPNSSTHVSGAFTGVFSGSILNSRLDKLEEFSSSLDAAFATDAQITTLSASFASRINAATNEQDLTGLLSKSTFNTFTASAATTGSNTFVGNQLISGSLLVSGSIIPNVGSGATSSFSLGSSAAAWKDIWVSQGTIHFLNGAGVSQGTLSTSANGIQSDGDIYVNSNLRVGKGPGNNGLNTVLGMGALQANTSGSSNTALGGSALSSNTTGDLNTAVGLNALGFNTTGYYNTAIGQGASYTNNGIANTTIGVRAGNGSTDVNNSTVMGYEALRNVTTGDGNMAIGYQAGYHASGSSTQNLYLGYQAGPTASITENFKLYIDFQQTDKPLIGGDFQQRDVTVNGMLNVTTFLTLPAQNPLPVNPSPSLGSMAVSGSALYFYNGSQWREVSLV